MAGGGKTGLRCLRLFFFLHGLRETVGFCLLALGFVKRWANASWPFSLFFFFFGQPGFRGMQKAGDLSTGEVGCNRHRGTTTDVLSRAVVHVAMSGMSVEHGAKRAWWQNARLAKMAICQTCNRCSKMPLYSAGRGSLGVSKGMKRRGISQPGGWVQGVEIPATWCPPS